MTIELGWWMVPFAALPLVLSARWEINTWVCIIAGWLFMAAARWL